MRALCQLRDIAAAGPLVPRPDYAKLKVAALTRDVAKSHLAPDITVSFGGQDGVPKPFPADHHLQADRAAMDASPRR